MQIDRVDLGKAIAENEFDKNLERSFQRLMDQLFQILNKGLFFSDNFNAYIGTVTTSAVADTESAIAHGLKRIPTGYLVVSRDKAGVVYSGSSAWTVSNIYVRSNVASVTIKILVF